MQSSRWRLQWFLIGVGWNSWFGLVIYWILMKRCRVLLYIFIVLEFPKPRKDTGSWGLKALFKRLCSVSFLLKSGGGLIWIKTSKGYRVILVLFVPSCPSFNSVQIVPTSPTWISKTCEGHLRTGGLIYAFLPLVQPSSSEWMVEQVRPLAADCFSTFLYPERQKNKKQWQICKYENNDRYVFKYRGHIALKIFLLDLRTLYSATSRIVES